MARSDLCLMFPAPPIPVEKNCEEEGEGEGESAWRDDGGDVVVREKVMRR